MADRFMSMKNLTFTLDSRQTRYGDGTHLGDHTPKTIDMVFKAAQDIGKKVMHPMFEEMDRHPPQLDTTGEIPSVKVHGGVRPMLNTLGRDGWIASMFPDEWGGEDMPSSLLLCINYIFATSNYSASVYAGLTMGAAKLILSFGDPGLQKSFLPQMLSGKWQGTMALTEPEAGTSLGDLATAAVPTEVDGQFKISGEKIFISAGDHDGVDNVVHLMLARIQGAKPGVKGISLFVVPKFRMDENNNLIPNDVVVTQVFHKLGYRGAPITGLRLGEKNDCMGYLVGEPHRGLSYMFQMMNNARLEVGMGATAIGTAAYYSALDYCRIRRQGRPVTAPKDSQPVPLITHPDVKRMLLFQRAVVEGALSLILHCGMYEDIIAQDPSQKDPSQKDCHLLLELLTPVAKTYPSEMGILSTSAAIQCLGGYGYCDDFPVEQHFRDMRIHTIHEGTTGIQAMDLLGRKLVMENGRALGLLKEEMDIAIVRAKECKGLEEMADDLSQSMGLIEKTVTGLGNLAMEKGADAYLADASLFLEMFGIVVIGWQWLTMASAAAIELGTGKPKKKEIHFLTGKLAVAQYFFTYELPKIQGLSTTLSQSSQMTLTLEETCFTD